MMSEGNAASIKSSTPGNIRKVHAMRPVGAKSSSRPEKDFLDRGVVLSALERATPRVRLMFVVRCGMRIRGLMQHRLVARGLDLMQSLGRRACLDPSIIDEGFIAALKFLKDCVEDREMPEVDDPDDKETSPYKVEAVAVARVYQEIRRWHDHEGNALWTAGLAAAESVDAIKLMGDVTEDEKGRLLDAHYRGLMSDLNQAKSGKEPKTHDPSPDGPWGPLWLDGTPEWFSEAERTRPLTRLPDWNRGWLSIKTKDKPSWRTLEKIVRQSPQAEELRLPAREGLVVPDDLDRVVAEIEESMNQAAELIKAVPAVAERLLPTLGKFAQAIQDSGHIMRNKGAAETLAVTPARVNQLVKLETIPCTEVLGLSIFPLTPIVELAKTDRPPGRPRQK